MYAVIMAGGKGTRLREITKDLIPKPMVQINGKPILEYQIGNLKRFGIKDLFLVISDDDHYTQSYYGDGSAFGVDIQYIIEKTPLGTAGALYYLKDILKSDFVLLFGDLIIDVDWDKFIEFHRQKQSLLTIFAHPNSHPSDSDLVVLDKNDVLFGIVEKNKPRTQYYSNLVNAGLYVINSEILQSFEELKPRDLEKDIIKAFLITGRIYGYKSPEYVKDVGTPSRFYACEKDIINGIVEARNLSKKQKAIFLDRDGTINKYVGFLTSINQFELISGVQEAISLINQSEYLAVVITNQPVVARGEVTFGELETIHKKMETQLGEFGAYLDYISYCPHHPHSGYLGEVKALKINCDCRKPKIGLLEEIKHRFNIDYQNSYFIGDSEIDVQTGINAGTKTIFLTTLDKEIETRPSLVAKDLLAAVKMILLKNGE